MPHVFEIAPSGRSKCRGCAQTIARGVLRFGERLPNLFGEGEMSLWFHPLCAAYKRPQSLLDGLASTTEAVPEREKLEDVAHGSLERRRLPRIDGAERAKSGQAKCRSCHSLIAKDSWRIRIAFYEEGRFFPDGYVHLSCRQQYFDTSDVLYHVLHFSQELGADERAELARAFADTPPA